MARNGRASHGFRGSRAVALVEYALVLGVLVVGSLGAIEALEDDAADEVDKQAECISERPPPVTCQPAANTPLGPGGGGVGGDPGGGDPGPTESVNFGPGTLTATRGADPIYDVEITVTLLDDSAPLPLPLEDEVITAKVTYTGSTFPGRIGKFTYVTCVSNGVGVCTFSFDSGFDDVTALTFQIVSVGADTPYDIGSTNEIPVPQPAPDSTVVLPIL